MLQKNDSKGRGFTLIELMVAMLLTMLLLGIIYGFFTTYSSVLNKQEKEAEMMQIAREGSDRIRDFLMNIGRGVKTERGQPMLVYASPHQLLFNADIREGDLDNAAGNCSGFAMLPSAMSSLEVNETFSGTETLAYTYTPKPVIDTCSHDVETYRIYVDPTPTEADYVDVSDLDHRILLEVNGGESNNGSQITYGDGYIAKCGMNVIPEGTEGINCETETGWNYNGETQELVYGVRWDDGSAAYAYSDGSRQMPLFTYWGDWDFNPNTPDELWGDLDNNGTLSDSEILNLYAASGTGYSPNFTTDSYAMRYGALVLTGGAAYCDINSEDKDCDGVLDDGEDLNGNRNLDLNLLDTQLHKIDVNITTIRKVAANTNMDPPQVTLRTLVAPRNLNEARPKACGLSPSVSSLSANVVTCDGVRVTWNASPDDGCSENDIMYYKLMRANKTLGETYSDAGPIAIIPAKGERDSCPGTLTYEYMDTAVENDMEYYYQLEVFDNCGQSNFKNPLKTSDATAPIVISTVETFGNLTNFSFAYSTPCYQSTNGSGSITIEFPSIIYADGFSGTEDGYEYWIYRSDPFDPNDEVPNYSEAGGAKLHETHKFDFYTVGASGDVPVDMNTDREPIAKIAIDEDGSSELAFGADEYGCGRGTPPTEVSWEEWCEAASFFAYPKKTLFYEGEMGHADEFYHRYYVFRDDYTGTIDRLRSGQGNSVYPEDGHQYRVNPADSSLYHPKENRYIYYVRVWDKSSGCLSWLANALYINSCFEEVEFIPEDDPDDPNDGRSFDPRTYADVQSFNIGAPARYFTTRFTPPMWQADVWKLNRDKTEDQGEGASIRDLTHGDSDGDMVAIQEINFHPSKSERCDYIFQEVEKYWIVRERYKVNESWEFPELTYTGQRIIFPIDRNYGIVAKDDRYNPKDRADWDQITIGEVEEDPSASLYFELSGEGTIASTKFFYSEDTCYKTPSPTSTQQAAEEADSAFTQDGQLCYGNMANYPSWLSSTEATKSEPKLQPHPAQTSTWIPDHAQADLWFEEQLIWANRYKTDVRHPLLDTGEEFEYLYYVIAVAEHEDSEGNAGYSIGANCPQHSSRTYNPDNLRVELDFTQCNLRDVVDMVADIDGSASEVSATARGVFEFREVAAFEETPDDWQTVWNPEHLVGSQLIGEHSFPFYKVGVGGANQETGWHPGNTYEFRFMLYQDATFTQYTEHELYTNVTPGIPGEPMVELRKIDCTSLEANILEFDMVPTAPYCFESWADGTLQTTPEDDVWYEIQRQYKYPWEDDQTEGPHGWKIDEDYYNEDPYLANKLVSFGVDSLWGDQFCSHPEDFSSYSEHYNSAGPRKYYVSDKAPLYANRQYRYKIKNWINQDFSTETPSPPLYAERRIDEQLGNEDCGDGASCDQGGDPHEGDIRATQRIEVQKSAWGTLCHPKFDGPQFDGLSYQEFNSITFNPNSRFWYNSGDDLIHEVPSRHSIPGNEEAEIRLGGYIPFTSDCWHKEAFWGLVQWESHYWQLANGNCAPGHTGYTAGSGCIQPLNQGSFWDYWEEIFNPSDTRDLHYHAWTNFQVDSADWEVGSRTANYEQYFHGSCGPSDEEEYTHKNAIVSFYTKGLTDGSSFGGSYYNDFNHHIEFLFAMDKDSRHNTPAGYRVTLDYGRLESPTWLEWFWQWIGLPGNRRDSLIENLTLDGDWSIFQEWAGPECLENNPGAWWCCHSIFSGSPGVCNSILNLGGYDFAISFMMRAANDYGSSKDESPHANLLFTCQEERGNPAIDPMQIYFMSVRDMDSWELLGSNPDYDLEKALFDYGLSRIHTGYSEEDDYHYGPLNGHIHAWDANGFRFNSENVVVEIKYDVLGLFPVTISTSPLVAIEPKRGRLAFHYDVFDFWDFLKNGDLKAPRYTIDNLRIRRYCGECPPRFLAAMDVDFPGLFVDGAPSGDKSMTDTNKILSKSQMMLPSMPFNPTSKAYDISSIPYRMNLQKALAMDDPEHQRHGEHPFYYEDLPDGRRKVTVVVTPASLKVQYGWTDAQVEKLDAGLKEMLKKNLLPLTQEKLDYMKSTGRLPN